MYRYATGCVKVGEFVVSNDPNSEAAAIARAAGGYSGNGGGGNGDGDGSDAIAPYCQLADGGRAPSWWMEQIEGSVRDEHLALQALGRPGGDRTSYSQLARDDERSRRWSTDERSRPSTDGRQSTTDERRRASIDERSRLSRGSTNSRFGSDYSASGRGRGSVGSVGGSIEEDPSV